MVPKRVLRLALIDDHVIFREALRRVLESDTSMRIVAEATTLQEALAVCVAGPDFDVALIDHDLNAKQTEGNGLTVLRLLRSARPAVGAIMVTAALPDTLYTEVADALHASIFLKTEPLAELQRVIQAAAAGRQMFSAQATLARLEVERRVSFQIEPFSARELVVLRSITEGLANKEIAGQLETTETNVKAIVQRLFLKTGVRSRSQLVRYVFELNVDVS